MSRKRRDVPPGALLHIVNRGNDRKVIFREPVDYASFLVLLREARERFSVELYAYCLMPNHFHLVVRVADLDAISAYMLFVQREHACDLRAYARTKGEGHVFQRRYWSKVIEGDGQFLTLLRYVEGNAVRARLVPRARDWEWGSLWDRTTGDRDLLHACPLWLPEGWATIVDCPLQDVDLQAIRRPLKIGRPRQLRES
ncbi:MAG TPA: transposase [Vicinamibacterales bacterium]|nr:transposase [Vicinamibacterales bacterium]